MSKESNEIKAVWFVSHIKAHLKNNQEVICKICGKSIEEIARENARIA